MRQKVAIVAYYSAPAGVSALLIYLVSIDPIMKLLLLMLTGGIAGFYIHRRFVDWRTEVFWSVPTCILGTCLVIVVDIPIAVLTRGLVEQGYLFAAALICFVAGLVAGAFLRKLTRSMADNLL